jgi:hypothetical protein
MHVPILSLDRDTFLLQGDIFSVADSFFFSQVGSCSHTEVKTKVFLRILVLSRCAQVCDVPSMKDG